MTYEIFLKQYGKHKVRFSSYYKYVFSFSNKNGLVVYSGGSSDDIYRFEVKANRDYYIFEIDVDEAYLNGKLLGNWRCY